MSTRWLARAGWIVATVVALAGLPAPASASGEMTVPHVTLTVSESASMVNQKITTSQNGYFPKVTIASGAARWVDRVFIKPSAVVNGAFCGGSGGTWSCSSSLDTSGYIQITYRQQYGTALLELGTFNVSASMGNNGQTFSGTGSVTVTTSDDLAMLTPKLEVLGGAGYATFRARNNGIVPSPMTVTVTGLGTVPVDDQGNGCSRSGSSLTCANKTPVPAGGTFLLQLKMTDSRWRSLRFTAKVSGPYPDPKTGNNSTSVGPYDPAPAASTTSGTTTKPSSGTRAKASSSPAPAAATPSAEASAEVSPSPTALMTASPAAPASALPVVDTVALRQSGSTHGWAGPVALVAAAMLVLGLVGAYLLRRRRAAVGNAATPDGPPQDQA